MDLIITKWTICKSPITMKNSLQGINFANFLQKFWKEKEISKIVIWKTAYRNPWTLDSGPWTLDAGIWTLNSELWMLDSGRWTLAAGPWTLDSQRWTLDAGCYTLDAGLWELDTIADCFRTKSEASFWFCLIKLLKILLVQIFKNLMITLAL